MFQLIVRQRRVRNSDGNDSKSRRNSTDLNRKVVENSTEMIRKVKCTLAVKHGNITACQQLNLSSCRYVIPASRNHITMTSEASSLVGDFWVILQPPAENVVLKTERFSNSGDIETWKMKVVVNRKAAVITCFHRGEFGRVNTVFLGVFTHTPPEGGK